jgi:hypothetical protein
MTEDQEQMYLIQWFRRTYDGVRIFHVPNGGARHPAVAAKLKLIGTMPGVPDLFVPAWNLWVEMKRADGGRLSPVQKDWIAYLEGIGHTVIVGHGFADAKCKIETLGKVPIK